MTLRFGQLTLAAILLGGISTSCSTFGDAKERQALLEQHMKLVALADVAENDSSRLATNPKPVSVSTQPEIIMPLGDPQPMVDEIGLAPDGPSEPFAPDPIDEVGLFPED